MSFIQPSNPGGAGSTTWIGLTDTPGSYAGNVSKITRVNDGETAIGFIPNILIDSTGRIGIGIGVSPTADRLLQASQNFLNPINNTDTNIYAPQTISVTQVGGLSEAGSRKSIWADLIFNLTTSYTDNLDECNSFTAPILSRAIHQNAGSMNRLTGFLAIASKQNTGTTAMANAITSLITLYGTGTPTITEANGVFTCLSAQNSSIVSTYNGINISGKDTGTNSPTTYTGVKIKTEAATAAKSYAFSFHGNERLTAGSQKMIRTLDNATDAFIWQSLTADPNATNTAAGIIRIATQAEANAGSLTTVALTPGTLANYTGIVDNTQSGSLDLIYDTSDTGNFRLRFGDGSAVTPKFFFQAGNELAPAVDIQSKFTNNNVGGFGDPHKMDGATDFFILGAERVDTMNFTISENTTAFTANYVVNTLSVNSSKAYGILGQLRYKLTSGAAATGLTKYTHAGIKGFVENNSISSANPLANINAIVGHAHHAHNFGNTITTNANGVVGYISKDGQSLLTTANCFVATSNVGDGGANTTATLRGLLIEAGGQVTTQIGIDMTLDGLDDAIGIKMNCTDTYTANNYAFSFNGSERLAAGTFTPVTEFIRVQTASGVKYIELGTVA